MLSIDVFDDFNDIQIAANDFYPVWVLWCLVSFDLLGKNFKQTSHLCEFESSLIFI